LFILVKGFAFTQQNDVTSLYSLILKLYFNLRKKSIDSDKK